MSDDDLKKRMALVERASSGAAWSGFIGCIVCNKGEIHSEDGVYSDERCVQLHEERGFRMIQSALWRYGKSPVHVCSADCQKRYETVVGPRHLAKMRELRGETAA